MATESKPAPKTPDVEGIAELADVAFDAIIRRHGSAEAYLRRDAEIRAFLGCAKA